MDYNEKDHSEDEVEDLFLLIKEIIEKHPEIKGVSSGAIKSTYQKNRVEDICKRLGLESLALMWDIEQPKLLQDMIDNQMNSILIKVACYGLNSSHLGKTLAEMQPTLEKLSQEYGVNSCGEGGEFESLTLDCPLFKKKIEM